MTAADGMGDDDEWSSSDDESPRPKQSKLTALLKKGVRIQQAADASAGGGPVGVPAVLAPPNISVLAPPPSASTRDAVAEVASEDIHHGRVNEGTSEAVIAEGELAEPGFAGTGTMAGAESVVGVDAATAAMRSAEEDAGAGDGDRDDGGRGANDTGRRRHADDRGIGHSPSRSVGGSWRVGTVDARRA